VITYYTEIPTVKKGVELLRVLEDARYTSYDNEYESSHNGILCGKFKYVGIWDDRSYVGYDKQNNVELRPATKLTWNKFIEFLNAEVSDDLI
jgi:hypothetical protein